MRPRGQEDRGTKEEESLEQLAQQTHREPTGEVPEAMETRPLKLEQHSLSRINSDVRVESVLHMSRRTINESIKPSFI